MTTTGNDQLDCIDPTAYGETYGFDHVMRNSIQRMSAFPTVAAGMVTWCGNNSTPTALAQRAAALQAWLQG